jgi:hypothetical protein
MEASTGAFGEPFGIGFPDQSYGESYFLLAVGVSTCAPTADAGGCDFVAYAACQDAYATCAAACPEGVDGGPYDTDPAADAGPDCEAECASAFCTCADAAGCASFTTDAC